METVNPAQTPSGEKRLGEVVLQWRGGRFAAAMQALKEAGDPARDPLVAAYAARLAQYPDGPPTGWSPQAFPTRNLSAGRAKKPSPRP